MPKPDHSAMGYSIQTVMLMTSSKSGFSIVVAAGLLALSFGLPGCFSKSHRDQSEALSQQLSEQKLKTDNLRNAMRYLTQMTPVNRKQAAKEVLLELNTWIQDADRTQVNYSPPTQLLDQLPADMLQFVGCENALAQQFGYWDIDYLFERRMMRKLSDWIVEFPIRDTLMVRVIDRYSQQLGDDDAAKLQEAYKLFDWTIRNIALEDDASSVEQMSPDPRGPIRDDGTGYGYLPWETLLFSSGDFIERGRVFCALASQRGIDTVWVSVESEGGQPGNLWSIGVVIGDALLLFEPKLGMPILDPDAVELATLADAKKNQRILRRLDLPGQFDYALDPGQLKRVELLIDVPPVATSARMKMLEKTLLSDERMVLYEDVAAIQGKLNSIAPDDQVSLWQLPLLAQIQAASVRERLGTLSPYTMQYMAMHGVWLRDNPAGTGRLNHLYGNFENTLEKQGALSMYMDCRVDDGSIAKLEYDPEVQKMLGVPREPGEDDQQYRRRIQQSQYTFSRAKVDAAFLLAQLHFDRGNNSAAEKWFAKRVLGDSRPEAVKWHASAWYMLARIHQQAGDIEGAAEALTHQPSPQEAGNRLRLRYLRREFEK